MSLAAKVALKKAFQKGYRSAERAYGITMPFVKGRGKVAFGQRFDMERVFWRIIFGIAIFLVLKVVWHIYRAGAVVQEILDVSPIERPEDVSPTNIAVQTFLFPGWGLIPLIRIIVGQVNVALRGSEQEEITDDKRKELEKNIGSKLSADPLAIVDKIFFEWWIFAIIAIIGIVLLMEFKQGRSLK